MSSDLVSRAKQRLEELNLSPRAASLRVSGNPDLFRNVLRKGPSANPTDRVIALMAEALEVPPAWLQYGTGEPTAPPLPESVHGAKRDFRRANVEPPNPGDMPKDLRVLGTAAGALVRHDIEGFEINGTVEYVRRPPALVGVNGAYAIYVTGDSMEPMHSQGELRFVHPGRPPQPGDTVVVVTKSWEDDPGQAYIKIYRRRARGCYVLEQLNPPAAFEVPEQYVVSIHKVPNMNELFGV